MTTSDPQSAGANAARVGDAVLAEDGELGHVKAIVRSERRVPLYIVIATGRFLRRRYPVLSCSLVEGVDQARRRVYISGRRARLCQLSESAPIAF
ncbi:MAG TPA: hypothetical protein VMK83_00635 [Gaiellaceae bacterium]|nr:hypothetical protein [Gaiellaceae bacterium]